ncbi:MAG: hypothetical protein Kow0027_14000 [Saprospiraceae bacterium]
MRIRKLSIQNFRGIVDGEVLFSPQTLLVGTNNVGKSTICEAIDLVLGPERLYRRPVIDEHDFYLSRYLDENRNPIEIRIEAILVDLSQEAVRRFSQHLRRWDDTRCVFIDEQEDALDHADTSGMMWALPLVFIGRYDREEDDFAGNTFFDHPTQQSDALDEETRMQLGQGSVPFTRAHKRLCGFVFLRTLRTGSRALSLQRGSLLDTVLRLGGSGIAEMWEETLQTLRALDPAIGNIDQLKQIRTEIRSRMSDFVNLASAGNSTEFYASNLTREHLREFVRLFIAVQPDQHLLPFERLGTGSINLLVFALLTFIADLKDKPSVIFAMEEPEIALPPHTQRRVTRFVLSEMGQAIITSHSPYVIEQFDPEQIIILNRNNDGSLTGSPIDTGVIKPKTYRTNRRQFAEAILSRAVLVVEGSTEAALFPVASSVMEASLPANDYIHFDLAGVSVFDAGADNAVPRYGPVFSALGKLAFAFYDKPKAPLTQDDKNKLGYYKQAWESPEKGIENLLIKEMPISVIRRFFEEVKNRADYPTSAGTYNPDTTDDEVRELAAKVLKARKGDAHGYAAILIAQCQNASELPKTIREILETIHRELNAEYEDITVTLQNDP